MNEKKYEWYAPIEGQKAPNSRNFKCALKTGAAILSLLTVTSCDTITEKWDDLRWIDPMERELRQQIKQQKKEARYERRLDNVSYTLKVKIAQRKDWVADYRNKLEECKADPYNRELKERTLQICQRIGEYNKEIKSLAKKELDVTIKLDDIRAKPHSGLPTWAAYTDPDHFDYLLRKDKQDNSNHTANYFDFAEESSWSTLNDWEYEDNPQCCKKKTLEDLINN